MTTEQTIINRTTGKRLVIIEGIDQINLEKAVEFYAELTSTKKVKILRAGYYSIGKALYEGKRAFPSTTKFGEFRDNHFPLLATRQALGSECIRFYLHFNRITYWSDMLDNKQMLNNPVTLCREFKKGIQDAYSNKHLDSEGNATRKYKVKLLTDKVDKTADGKNYIGKLDISYDLAHIPPESDTTDKGIAGCIDDFRLAGNKIIKDVLPNLQKGHELEIELNDIIYTIRKAWSNHIINREGFSDTVINLNDGTYATEIDDLKTGTDNE